MTPPVAAKNAPAGDAASKAEAGAPRDRPPAAADVSSAKQLYAAPAGGEHVIPGLKFRVIEQRDASRLDEATQAATAALKTLERDGRLDSHLSAHIVTATK